MSASSRPPVLWKPSRRTRLLLGIASLMIVIVSSLSVVGSASTVAIATDAATGFNSIASSGAQKLFQDSYGKTIAVYVDTVGKLAITYDNSYPTLAGTWAAPWKSSQPTAAYARPAALLVSPTLLRVIVEGGSGAGRITDVPVSIQRDSQGNILGFIGGTATAVDSSGLAKFPSAVLAHNGDILAAWSWVNGTESARVRTARWQPGTGWGTFEGGPGIDDAIVDRSSVSPIIPNLIEREDNFNAYLIANRGGVSKLVFNEAVFGSEEGGANWVWGSQNLAYESNVSSGSEDAVSVAWDEVRSVVVASYSLSNAPGYGVFRLNALDQKTHLDTPSIVTGDKDWGTIVVHPPTGDYFLFLVTSSVDAGSGTVAFTRFASGTWNSTLTVVDSETNNQGVTAKRNGDPASLDIVYAKGTSGQRQLRFFRIVPSGKLAATLTIQANPNPSNPGDLVSVSGVLAEELNDLPIQGRTVSIQESNNLIAWTTLGVPTTDVNGAYSATTTFAANGIYYLRAVFAGDNEFQPVTSAPLYQGVGTFIFSSAGDIGASARTTLSLGKLASSGSHVFVALGDLSYSQITPESGWCGYIHDKLGDNYSFELLSGNHEDGQEIQDGLIDNFAACLPDRLGNINGVYAKEYYFDYPASRPLARFILVSPNLNFTNGGYYNYNLGTPRYNWVSSTIDSARATGIPWIVVGMHKNCITLGINNCEIGPDLMNLFINKRVDLVLQGHDHIYARSKQLTCATVDLYMPSCVSNDGSTGSYVKGYGTVFIITGNIGQGQHFVNTTDTEAQYFARATGSNGYWNGAGAVTPGLTYGFVKFTVTATQISAGYVNSTGPFTDSFTITNQLPVLQVPGPQTINEGSLLSFNVTASDPDTQQTVTLSASGFSFGMSCHTATGNPASTTFTWTPTEDQGPGDYAVVFTADDGNGGVVTAPVAIHVTEVNQYPIIFVPGPQRATAGELLTFTVSASDPDIPPNTIIFSSTGLPPGASFNSTSATFSFLPDASQIGQTFVVSFTATDDGSPALSDTKTVDVFVGGNSPPTLSPSGPWFVDEGSLLSFTVNGTGPDPGRILTITAYNMPTGAKFYSTPSNSTVTGVFSWTPDESQGPGVYTILLVISDGVDQSSMNVTVTVNEVNTPPVLSVPGDQSVNEDSNLAFTVSASDSDIPANSLTFSVQDLPSGASFNNGVFSWIPSEAQGPGDYTITFTVTDNGNLSDTKSVVIHVAEVNSPPVLTVPGGQSVNVNSTLTFTVTASDLDLPPNTITITVSGLVQGMTFTPLNGNPASGALSFTPSSGQAGNIFVLTFTATDNGSPVLSSTRNVTITVSNSAAYALVVSAEGKVFRYYQNGTLTLVGWPTNNTLRQVAWRPDGSIALIVGDKATLIRYDGTQLVLVPTGIPNGVNFWSVSWKPDGSYALVGGTNGRLLKYDGTTVTTINDPYTTTIYSVSWRPGGAYALMVGKSGLMLTYDGVTVRSLSSGTNSDLNTVAWSPLGSYALAGGANGVILRFNGTTTTFLNTTGLYNTAMQVRSISFNSQGSLALLVGDGGFILSYDGSILRRVTSPTTSYLYGVSWLGSAATIVGGSGTVLTDANGTVTKVKSNVTVLFKAIAWQPN